MDKTFIYEIADKLEEKCKQRRAHNFYYNLKRENPDFINDLRRLLKRTKYESIKFQETKYDLKEMIDIVLKFYEGLDGELYDSIQKILKDEKTVKKFAEPSEKGGLSSVGVVVSKKDKDKIFIQVDLNPENNIQGFINIAHEFAHITEQRVQEKKIQDTDCLGEIAPMFMEKVFMEYLVAKGLFSKEEKAKSDKALEMDMAVNAKVLIEESEILKGLRVPITGEQLVDLEKKLRGTPKYFDGLKRIETMIYGKNGRDIHGERVFRYIVGHMVAKPLFEDFLKNPNETLEKYKYFVKNNAEMTKEEAFECLLGDNYKERMSEVLLGVNQKQNKNLV